jgi:large subunit ribosomal protein L10
MNRQQKEEVVSSIRNLFSESEAAFLVNYRGLSVLQMQELRKQLRDSDGILRIAKARLMKIAVKDVGGVDAFKDNFCEQVGLVFAKKEVPSVAKQLVAFSKEHEAMSVVSGFFESNVITEQQINFLSSLPSREELLAILAGTLQAPVAGLARSLQMVIAKLLYALKQIVEKKESSGSA